MKRKFIIDTDTASDDAVALIMAINSPEVQIEAITVVAGNVSLEQGVQNAMYTIALCGKSENIPVYKGMSKPLIRDLETATHVHGEDGMSDIGLELNGFVPEDEHAVTTIIEKINQFPDEITLVCLAPLTNIATAISMDTTIVKKVKECVIMGGVGLGRGNVTPVSEYNIWADPEAAKIVFESGIPIRMVGWDISREYAVFEDVDTENIKKIGTPLANFAVNIQKKCLEFSKNESKIKGFDLPDPIAMAVALDKSVATQIEKAHITILTNNDYSRGQTVIDYTGTTHKAPNVEVVLKADRAKFLKILHSVLS